MTIAARRFAVGSDRAEVVELQRGTGGQLDDQQVLWIDASPEAGELELIDEALGLDGVVAAVRDVGATGVRFVQKAIRFNEIDERALRREPTDDLLRELVAIRRRIAILRRTIGPQREVYAALARPIGDEGSPIGVPWPELTDRLERTIAAVERARDLLLGSFDIVMTRTGQRTNDIMRALTVVSSVLLPAVVVGGVMGMNFHPGFFDDPSLFFVVIVAMAALAILTLLFVRVRGWL